MATLREWRRPAREAWWALLGFSIFFVIVGLLVVHAMPAYPSTLEEFIPVGVLLTYCLIGAVLAYRVFAHARVIATPSGLLISNPFRSDQFVDWSDIDWMRADRLLTIGLTNGSRVIAWVIQKNGWNRARHDRTAADDAIDELSLLASEQTGAARMFAKT